MNYKLTVITPDDTHELECADDQYILDAIDDAGIDIAYSCRAGACSSCAGKITSGTVDQRNKAS